METCVTLWITSQDGWPSIMYAAYKGHEKVVIALHGFGADVNAKNNVSGMIFEQRSRAMRVCFMSLFLLLYVMHFVCF